MPELTETRERRPDAPLVSWSGAALALLVALCIGWPMWLTGELVVFADTATYLKGGEAIWDRMLALLPQGPADVAGTGSAAGAGAAVGALADETGGAVTARGFPYAFGAYLFWKIGAMPGLAVAQTWITVFTAFGLVGAAALTRPVILGAGALWLICLTPLPWAAALLIPDLVAAVPILFAVVLAVRWQALGPWQRVVLTALAALAASMHYGLMPLAAGAVAVALVARSLAVGVPSVSAVVASAAVVLFGPLLNLAVSTAALESPSVTPLRLPILLARSIEDGPARWYLEDACPEADLALCRIFGRDIPDNVGTFLWSGKGMSGVTPAQMAQVRDEEWTVLGRAFARYPLAQTGSLLSNAAEQTVRIGVGGVRTMRRIVGPEFEIAQAQNSRLVALHAWVKPLIVPATVAGTLVLSAAALALGMDRRHWAAVLVTLAGLAGNALIFGGLSAPAERYQARVVWCLGLVLLIVIAERSARRGTPEVAR